MPLKYLIDEHLRGKFAQALIARGLAENLPLDVVETGDDHGPALSTQDPDLIRWAQAHNRVIVSLDENTLPDHLAAHLAEGGTSPGILLLRRGRSWDEVLYYLVLYAETVLPEECRDQCIYVPV